MLTLKGAVVFQFRLFSGLIMNPNPIFCQNFHSSFFRVFLSFGLVLFATACSHKAPAAEGVPGLETASRWVTDGQIIISRSAPEVSDSDGRLALGFLPLSGAHVGPWLSVDRSSETVQLMDGSKVVAKSAATGIKSLKDGVYQLQHKQRNPLWYAPDTYFQDRNLPLPPEGDKSRFRRGALGDYVIFINKDTPIHCGPLWSEMIGGIKIDESELAKLYYSLEVGSMIEVK